MTDAHFLLVRADWPKCVYGAGEWYFEEWDDVYWTVVGESPVLPDLRRAAP